MQTKDIDKIPVLKMLADNPLQWHHLGNGIHGVGNAMPDGTPRKLQLAVMRNLINRGLVEGCTCGCRGDFEITNAGIAYLEKQK